MKGSRKMEKRWSLCTFYNLSKVFWHCWSQLGSGWSWTSSSSNHIVLFSPSKNVCWMFLLPSGLCCAGMMHVGASVHCLNLWTLPAVLPRDAVLDANHIGSIALHMLRTHRLPLIYKTVLSLAPSLTEIPWWERKTLKNCTPQVSCPRLLLVT